MPDDATITEELIVTYVGSGSGDVGTEITLTDGTSYTTYNVELKTGNLLDKTIVDEIESDYDYIYHLAAIIGVQNVLNRSYEVLANNVILTIIAIDIAKKQEHLKRLLFASTSEVYAGTLSYHGLEFPTAEDTPLTVSDLKHPRTSYMISKIYGEALLSSGADHSIKLWTI